MANFPPTSIFVCWLLPALISFAVAAVGVWLAASPYRRLPAGAHWTDKARLLWPLRVARGTAVIWVPMGASLVSLWPSVPGFVGALLGARLVFRRLHLPASADISGLRSLVF